MAQKTFKVSDESVNSKGIVVRTSGIRLERFLKNPVMFYDHDRSLVIGRWENLSVSGIDMFADPIFDIADPEAAKIAGKVERDFIRAASLGIYPIEYEYNEVLDAVVVTVSELKEISVCGIPSNENSIALYDDQGEMMPDGALLQLKDDLKQKFNLHDMKKIPLFAKVLCLADTVTEDDILLAVQKLADDNTSLKVKVTDLEKLLGEAGKQKVIILVDSAIAANKILAGEKEDYIKLATADYETTAKLLAAKTPHLSLADALKNQKVDDSRKDWKFDDYHQKDPKGLEAMRKDNPDLYDKLYKEKFNA